MGLSGDPKQASKEFDPSLNDVLFVFSVIGAPWATIDEYFMAIGKIIRHNDIQTSHLALRALIQARLKI